VLNFYNVDALLKKPFQRALMNWFKKNRRDLPWRHTTDPYAIWVSEMMLQQTQVDQVVPYYLSFMKRFPTLQHLSDAPLDDVLKIWEGLGYYKRAVFLHKSAGIIVREYGGQIPADYRILRSLPGFGEYTAGAVLSLAYHQKRPAVDGNAFRVMARIIKFKKPINRSANKRTIINIITALLPDKDVSSFNQGLMELGALICKPVRPLCSKCPLKRYCQAYNDLPDAALLPVKPKRKPIPFFEASIGIINRNKKILVLQRPAGGLLGGLWEFPGGKMLANETPEKACIREIKEETGITVRVIRKLMVLKHAYSHFKVKLHVYLCDYQSGKMRIKNHENGRWIRPAELHHVAVPGANRKIISYYFKQERP